MAAGKKLKAIKDDIRTMKSNTFYIISPCVIAIIILGLGILINYAQGGWHMLGVVAGLPFIAILAVIAIITKLVIRKNNGLLWIVEAVLVVACFIVLPHVAK